MGREGVCIREGRCVHVGREVSVGWGGGRSVSVCWYSECVCEEGKRCVLERKGVCVGERSECGLGRR